MVERLRKGLCPYWLSRRLHQWFNDACTYILIEAHPDKTNEVHAMLADILTCVQDEPATGPWYAVQHSATTFAIFEVFPDLAGRRAHVAGGGGDIFRDVERMNDILAAPAHVQKVDVLLSKQVFTAPPR